MGDDGTLAEFDNLYVLLLSTGRRYVFAHRFGELNKYVKYIKYVIMGIEYYYARGVVRASLLFFIDLNCPATGFDYLTRLSAINDNNII